MGDENNTKISIRDNEKGSVSGKKVVKTKPKESEKLLNSIVTTANIYRTASTWYNKRIEDAKASRGGMTENLDTDGGGQEDGENACSLETLEVALKGSSPWKSQRTNFGKEQNRYVALTNTVKKVVGKRERSGADHNRRTQSKKVTPKTTTNLQQDEHIAEPALRRGARSANTLRTVGTGSS